MGIEAEEKEKSVKKKFSALSKKKQARVETAYHRMKPEHFDDLMSSVTTRTPSAVRLPQRLVKKLKTFADQNGKTEYQTMVRTWIEDRLRQEASVR